MWIGEGREDEEEEGSSGEHLEQTTATERFVVCVVVCTHVWASSKS